MADAENDGVPAIIELPVEEQQETSPCNELDNQSTPDAIPSQDNLLPSTVIQHELSREILAIAELQTEGWCFPLVAADGDELSIGSGSEDGSLHPDIDLAILLGGKNLSGIMGWLRYRSRHWFIRLDTGNTDGNQTDSQIFEIENETLLGDRDQIQLGHLILTFRQLEQLPVVGMDKIELFIDSSEATVVPGDRTGVAVTVIKHIEKVNHLRFELLGVPDEWYRVVGVYGVVGNTGEIDYPPEPVIAEERAEPPAQFAVVFSPPRISQSRAGRYPLLFIITASGETSLRSIAHGWLVVQPYQQLEMKVEPEENRGPEAEYLVSLYNAGNEPVSAELIVQGDGILYKRQRPRLRLDGGERDQIWVQVKAQRRQWWGPERIYPLMVKAVFAGLEWRQQARLICPPRIPLRVQSVCDPQRLLQFTQRVKKIRRQPRTLLFPILVITALAVAAFLLIYPPEVKEFRVEPASVVAGEPATLFWWTGGGAASIEHPWGTERLKGEQGSLQVTPSQSSLYTLTARNRIGAVASKSLFMDVKPAPASPRIQYFSASSDRIIREGEPVILRWSTEGATRVTIEPASEVRNPGTSGEAIVRPVKSISVYRLVALNEAGKSVEATKNIIIEPPKIGSFEASPPSIVKGDETILRWSIQGATKATVRADKGEVVPGQREISPAISSPELAVSPSETTIYTLSVSNAGGEIRRDLQVRVADLGPPKVEFFVAAPISTVRGGESILSFSVKNVRKLTIRASDAKLSKEIVIDQGFSLRDQLTVYPEKTTVYVLVASNGSEEISVPAVVEVRSTATAALR